LVKKLLTISLLILLSLSLLEPSLCGEDLKKSVREVYFRLAEAEKRGADVRDAALKLEKALELIRAAKENPEKRDDFIREARELIEEVNASIPKLIQEGEARIFWKNVAFASAASILVASIVLIYHYGPRIFWGTWLKMRSKWIVEVLERRRKKEVDEH